MQNLIKRIHDSGHPVVLSITGGGSRAISELLSVGGASRTLLEAIVPYSSAALDRWLGAPPQNYCDSVTARAMGMASFLRALELSDPQDLRSDNHWIGIGCTASLASDRPKRGPHRIHVAAQIDHRTMTWSLELRKDARSRAEEESLATQLVIGAVAEACDVGRELPLALLEDEHVETHKVDAPQEWSELLLGKRSAVRFNAPFTETTLPDKKPSLVFPGAFHPIHAGHRRMAKIAAAMLGREVAYEISILNVDKPPLDFISMQQRAEPFVSIGPLWFTRAAKFQDKAAIFAGATFIVGADTITRIADPCYYGQDVAACEAAIKQFTAHDCRFLVFGRVENEQFVSLSDLKLPPALMAICREVDERTFRDDISSTHLRVSNKDSPGT